MVVPPEYADLTLLNLTAKFPNEDACKEFLTEQGLIPRKEEFDGKDCPSVFNNHPCAFSLSALNETHLQSYKARWLIKCRGRKRARHDTRQSGCSKSWNPLKGSWFERSHISFQEHLILIYFFVAKAPLNFAVEEGRISKVSISRWFGYCRDLCQFGVDNAEKIGGPGLKVEIDECLLYTPKYHRGRPNPSQTWVVGGKDETGRIFLEIVNRRYKATLHDVIRRRVEPLSLVHTDQWGAYIEIDQPNDPVTGFRCNMGAHFTVNHSEDFVAHLNIPNPNGDGTAVHIRVTNNHIERVWKDLRKHIKCARNYVDAQGAEVDLLQPYVSSFIYHFNVLKPLPHHRDRFFKFLADIRTHYPTLTYDQLVANP